MTPSRDISRLLEIMARLRTPVTGCPWDLEQNFATIAPYTIEEAYEVADAIARGDVEDLKDELGDLLLQVVYHARMAEEQNAFSFGDVVEAITRKMIRRHPHVFADKDGNIAPSAHFPKFVLRLSTLFHELRKVMGTRKPIGSGTAFLFEVPDLNSPRAGQELQIGGTSGIKSAWERIKAEEKAERAARRSHQPQEQSSLLAGIKAGLPALTRAMELQRKASTVGFDWNDPRAVLNKIREETDEIEAALDRDDRAELASETGDLLFAVVNLARHIEADPDMALRGANAKFERRFGYIERALASRGCAPQDATLDEMDALWNEAKSKET